MRITGPGQALFAATLIGLGLFGLLTARFAAIWPPVPRGLPASPWVYVCAIAALAGGLGLLFRRAAFWAAGLLALFFLGWMLASRGPAILARPADAAAWESAGEMLVLAAAAWALNGRWPRLASLAYGAALLAFGAAHFGYARETAALVPAWLPHPTLWARLTGATYIAAGAAIASGVAARPAAILVAVQIGLFTLLVWLPRVADGHASADTWSEAVISFTLGAAAWALAETIFAGRGGGARRGR